MKYLKDAADPAPPPHKRPTFQYYMHKVADKVDAIYNDRWPLANRDDDGRLAFRTVIARELWEAEDESFRKVIVRERDQEHESDLRAYHAQQEALTRAGDEESQAR